MFYGVKQISPVRVYHREVEADSGEEAIAKLGLTQEQVSYVLLIGGYKSPPSEETKAKLAALHDERRALRKKGG